MEPAVDVVRVAGNRLGGVTHEKCAQRADVVDVDFASQRRTATRFIEQLVEVPNAGRRTRLDRSWRNGVDPDAAGPELGREIPNGRFERGLYRTHDAVARNDLLGADIGHGEQGPALVHERLGEARHAHEGVARDVHGASEAFA